MKDIVLFFWTSYRRAVQMDSANKLLNKPTHYWIQAEEWIEAYKKTLSNKNKKTFDYEWKKLDDQAEAFYNATDKQLKSGAVKHPFQSP